MTLLLRNPSARNSFILIENDVIATVRQYRQVSAADPEAGGILIGYRRGAHIHIVEATTPAPEDARSRYEFNRIDQYHARHAKQRWLSSRGKLDCVGEWHTHPQARPQPSGLDLAEWRRVLALANGTRVFAIVGVKSDWIGVGHGHSVQRVQRVSRQS